MSIDQDTILVEKKALGAALLAASSAETLAETVLDSDWYVPSHAQIFHAIRELVADGSTPLPAEVYLKGRELYRDSWITSAADLTQLQSEADSIHIGGLADKIHEYAILRTMQALGAEIQQQATSGLPAAEIIGHAEDRVRRAGDLITGRQQPAMTLGEFLDQPSDYDWLIPGWLERGDRVIFSGGEGMGKSTIIRQLLVQAAAGIQPFGHGLCEPVRSLLVDVENSPRQMLRGLSPIYTKAKMVGSDPASRMMVEHRAGGLDLTSRVDAAWLTEKIVASGAQLVGIGPMYKLASGNPNDEEPAQATIRVFDRLRERHGITFIFETHSPHAQNGQKRVYRPYGTSLWQRWPELGVGITPNDRGSFDLVRWRGDRDPNRLWPDTIRKGGTWPWTIV